MKRQIRARLGKYEPTDWKTKVTPEFVRHMQTIKRAAVLNASSDPEEQAKAQAIIRNPPPELLADARRLWRERESKNDVYLNPLTTILGLDALPPGSELQEGLLELHLITFLMHGRTFEELQADAAHSEAARRKGASAEQKFVEWKWGVHKFRDFRFKQGETHLTIMTLGLAFGIASLSRQELTDCFDELCWCGEPHDPDNLGKLRTRIIARLNRKHHQ